MGGGEFSPSPHDFLKSASVPGINSMGFGSRQPGFNSSAITENLGGPGHIFEPQFSQLKKKGTMILPRVIVRSK